MIYLDNNAITPPIKEVLNFVYNLIEKPLNPSSLHSSGRNAKNIVENSRKQILDLLGLNINAREYRVIFTATGTEANNLILSNYVDADIFISAVEHMSIFEQQNYYQNIKIIKVDANGVIDIENLEQLLEQSDNKKKLISVMLANNETGAIQPIKKITELAKKFNACVHSDSVQAIGKMLVNIAELDLDFMTISGHKFGSISGAAALIIKNKHHLKPMLIGGRQELGVRSGTENVLAIAGLGLAAEIAKSELEFRINKMSDMQKRLESKLSELFPEITIFASKAERLPNTSLVSLAGIDASVQLVGFDLRGIAVSSGSACSSGKVGKSYVLKAMGVEDFIAKSAIRISTCHNNLISEIDYFINAFKEIHDKRN